jgi:hypothetical protein
MKKDLLFERKDIWREGKWLDLWSVVHFLSGISMGFVISVLHFDTRGSIVIACILLIAYELWEAMVKIEETPTNRVMDVVVGMVSFLPTYLLLAPALVAPSFIIVFVCVLTLNIVLSYFGWRESQKAAALEARLRREFEEQKQKFKERRARLIIARERRRTYRQQKKKQDAHF